MARNSATSTANPIVAVVGDDGRYEHVRRRAVELARERDAGVVLYDLDAGERLLESPLPTDWSADGEEEQFGHRLDVSDLEALGRRPLAEQVRRTQADGVQAWGWLPDSGDPEALRDYADRQGASLVVVPAEERKLAERLRGGVDVIASDRERDVESAS